MSEMTRVCRNCGGVSTREAVSCANCHKSFRPALLNTLSIIGMIGAFLLIVSSLLELLLSISMLWSVSQRSYGELERMLRSYPVSMIRNAIDIGIGFWGYFLIYNVRQGSAAAWRKLPTLWLTYLTVSALGLILAFAISAAPISITRFGKSFLIQAVVVAVLWWQFRSPIVANFCQIKKAPSEGSATGQWRVVTSVTRIAFAVALGLALTVLWYFPINYLYGRPDMRPIAIFLAWAGAGPLLALSARIARERRWVVGILLLGLHAVISFCIWGLDSGLGGGMLHPWLPYGVLLGTFVLAPAILFPSQTSTPRVKESVIWGVVAGALVLVLVSAFATPEWRNEFARRKVLAAAEDLVRRDVLTHPEPIHWKSYRWTRETNFFAQGLMPRSKVSLFFRSSIDTPHFGRKGQAEGLRTNGLFISIPIPHRLGYPEAENLEYVKEVLHSSGVKSELLARLSPQRIATYNGVTYFFDLGNRMWSKTEHSVLIECRGVRRSE